LNEALRRALENLEASTRQSGATIITEELPNIDADMVQMTQLFQNLVANALKFTQNSKEPRVEVSYSTLSGTEEVRNQYCEIRIKDNGIGFDEKYLDKIFQPFERLKQKGVEHEGTGIGLAICRRIVERHGGRITARSTPDEGSTFIVTLPFFQGGVPGHE
jgi:signal transduction histidine kinase